MVQSHSSSPFFSETPRTSQPSHSFESRSFDNSILKAQPEKLVAPNYTYSNPLPTPDLSDMSFGARRLHRLPQRLDYNLIPAPLDLSLTRATEKSPLPAIIVTPSSPAVGAPEYYIAFLTPPPKPSLRERITQLPPFRPFLSKARSALFVSLLLFILVCHLLAHFAAYRPHFDLKSSDAPVTHSDSFATSSWNLVHFDFQSLWDTTANGDRRNYIVEELSQAAHR